MYRPSEEREQKGSATKFLDFEPQIRRPSTRDPNQPDKAAHWKNYSHSRSDIVQWPVTKTAPLFINGYDSQYILVKEKRSIKDSPIRNDDSMAANSVIGRFPQDPSDCIRCYR